MPIANLKEVHLYGLPSVIGRLGTIKADYRCI